MQSEQPSFSRGEINPLLYARVDESLYRSALRTARNMFVRVEGGVGNRAGTQVIAETKVSAQKSNLFPFVVSTAQPYLLEVGVGYVRFYAGGAAVLSGGTPTEVPTPYQEADLPLLRICQSADTLTIFHPSYTQAEIKRVSATSFAYTLPEFKTGPFLDTNTDKSNLVYATGRVGVVQLVSTAPIWNANHVGSLFYLEQQDLSQVSPWEPGKLLTIVGRSEVIGILRRSDGKTYQAASQVGDPASQKIATGTVTPIHDEGTRGDGDGHAIPNFADSAGVNWLYRDAGYGIFRITQYQSPTAVLAQVLTTPPSNVVGGPAAIHAPWIFTGDGSTLTFSPLTGNNDIDPTKYLVLVAGVVQTPDTYTITQPNGNIVFQSAPANGAQISVTQLSANNQSYFWALGAWSADQGYPATGTYFGDRLATAGTPANPQAFWLSKVSQYHDYGHSTPQVDSDALDFKLNSRQINPIRDLIPLNDLVATTQSVVWRIYPGFQGGALTPSNIDAKPQNFYGSAQVASVLYADSAIYVTNGGRKIRDLLYELNVDKFQGNELTILSRHLIPRGVAVTRMAYAPEPFGQLFVVLSNGRMLSLTYEREQQVVGWCPWDTQGAYEDVCVIPEGDSYATYVIVKRTINGVTRRFIERFAPREFADSNDWFFVDCGLQYDGRNTTSTTMTLTGGTTWQQGDSAILEASSTVGWGGFSITGVSFDSTDITWDSTLITWDSTPFFEPISDRPEIWLYAPDGTLVRVQVVEANSTTHASVRILDNVPASLQNLAVTKWTYAVTHFTIPHLPNTTLSVSADGASVGPVTTDANGRFELPTPGGVVTAGLGYDSDVETLSLAPLDQTPIRDNAKLLLQCSLVVNSTVGISVGTSEDDLLPVPIREFEPYVNPTDPESGIMMGQYMPTSWNDDAHVFIRQGEPLPFDLLMAIQTDEIGESG